jgi:hypothetical protein
MAAETRLSPAAEQAVLHGLAMVNASRQGYRGNIAFEGADRALVPMALAGIAVALLDRIEALGGDPDEALRAMYDAVTHWDEHTRHEWPDDGE